MTYSNIQVLCIFAGWGGFYKHEETRPQGRLMTESLTQNFLAELCYELANVMLIICSIIALRWQRKKKNEAI